MRKIKLSFRTSKIDSKEEETIEVSDDTTDEELDAILSDWLWERSDAHWEEA